MQRRRGARLSALAAAAALTLGVEAHAERFIDLYAGASLTEDDVLKVERPPTSSVDVSADDSASGGFRVGTWLESIPYVGGAVDLSFFTANLDASGSDIYVVPITPMLLLRYPFLRDDEFENGRLFPYIGVGLGIFGSVFHYGTLAIDVGLDARGGVRFQLTPGVGIFAEYRRTQFEPNWKRRSVDVTVDLVTNHASLGIGFEF